MHLNCIEGVWVGVGGANAKKNLPESLLQKKNKLCTAKRSKEMSCDPVKENS